MTSRYVSLKDLMKTFSGPNWKHIRISIDKAIEAGALKVKIVKEEVHGKKHTR